MINILFFWRSCNLNLSIANSDCNMIWLHFTRFTNNHSTLRIVSWIKVGLAQIKLFKPTNIYLNSSSFPFNFIYICCKLFQKFMSKNYAHNTKKSGPSFFLLLEIYPFYRIQVPLRFLFQHWGQLCWMWEGRFTRSSNILLDSWLELVLEVYLNLEGSLIWIKL